MYVYLQTEPGLWTVGHYNPSGEFLSESDHDDREKAAQRVHWLNGGRVLCRRCLETLSEEAP